MPRGFTVTFSKRGVNARTILTYSQSEDPTSPWSADQTKMFAREQWVQFPFAAAQIVKQQISKRVVSGG